MSKIILLRGLAREQKHWDQEFLNMLIRRDLVPVMIDLPGAGEYRDLTSPTEVEDYVSFLQTRIRDVLDEGEKAYLLGHSLGGMIAIRWAFEYPENFNKVFLVNTSDKRSRSLPERLRPFGLWQMFNIMKTRNIKKQELEILKMNSNNNLARQKALPKWVSLACSRPVKIRSILNQLLAASKFEAPSKLEVPLLYISSKADRMVSYKCSKRLAKQHHANILLHDRAGHDIPLDDPDWLVDCIASGLIRSPEQSAP